ncbi:QacE family quaternary ammonium compound efflux SMR transporter [bacterium LRH843]|nr:QacE family quaternary ammonium compound efflux SMR transporter [bacterium LRH843]
MKQNREWLFVVIAAVFEVGWVVGLKHASTVVEWLATSVAIIVSFGLLIRAGNELPVGTVYAVFVGLGTVGTILMDAFYFGEPLRLPVVILIVLLLIGIIGLKSTNEAEKVKAKGE